MTMSDKQPSVVPPAEQQVCCPQCGYDLRAIPEGRCPECGFGYDHRSVLRMNLAASGMRAGLHADTYRRLAWVFVNTPVFSLIDLRPELLVLFVVFLQWLTLSALLLPVLGFARPASMLLRIGQMVRAGIVVGIFAYLAIQWIPLVGVCIASVLTYRAVGDWLAAWSSNSRYAWLEGEESAWRNAFGLAALVLMVMLMIISWMHPLGGLMV